MKAPECQSEFPFADTAEVRRKRLGAALRPLGPKKAARLVEAVTDPGKTPDALRIVGAVLTDQVVMYVGHQDRQIARYTAALRDAKRWRAEAAAAEKRIAEITAAVEQAPDEEQAAEIRKQAAELKAEARRLVQLAQVAERSEPDLDASSRTIARLAVAQVQVQNAILVHDPEGLDGVLVAVDRLRRDGSVPGLMHSREPADNIVGDDDAELGKP